MGRSNTTRGERSRHAVGGHDRRDQSDRTKVSSDFKRKNSHDRETASIRIPEVAVGVLHDDKKLEWMYKASDLVNREEYLLGRSIDKTFEQLDAVEKEKQQEQHLGIIVPKNHVEHECIPFSIRSYRDAKCSEQVDMARKIMEDPLIAIKQKEMDSRRKILENPVKLKELHELLKEDRSAKNAKKSKESKKKHKSKKKHSKRHRGRSSSSDSDSEKMLDALLEEKYKKVQSVLNKDNSDMDALDLNTILSMKYDKLSKELDKMAGKKRQSKKNRSKSRSPSEKRQRSRSPRLHNRNRSRDRSDRRERQTDSPQQRRRHTDRERPKSPKRYTVEARHPDHSHHHRSPSPIPSSRRANNSSDDDDNRERRAPKNYGLVTADGNAIKLKYASVEVSKPKLTAKKAASPPWPARKRLTEAERESMRQEMVANAGWRDKERESNVKRYRDDEKRALERDSSRAFDRQFITKELKKATANVTVESRIRSKQNNLQRSKGAMDSNFARR